MRRVMRSTVPMCLSPTEMMSPTPNWFSTSRKKPPITSLMRLWAPKPKAAPMMPRPATRGPTLTLNSCRVSMMKKAITATRAMFSSTEPRVLARRMASGLPSLSAAPRDRFTALPTSRMPQRIRAQVTITRNSRCSFAHPFWSSQTVNASSRFNTPRTIRASGN